MKHSARSIPARLFELSWPVIGLNVLNVLALAVDTAMCGRLPDAEQALQGLGFATQLVFLLMVVMLGLTVGTVALVARAHGAGDHARVHHVFNQSAQLTFVLGIAVAVVGNVFAAPLLDALGANAHSREAGLAYLRPLLCGTSFYYLAILYGAVLRGVGKTRLPFFVALAANVVNAACNYGLILGHYGLPQLGVFGAAIGTVTSQVFSVVTMTVLLRSRRTSGPRPSLAPRAVDWALARELYRVGWPAALDLLILNASFLSIVGMLGRVSQAAVAAHGLGLRVQALAFVPGMSVSQATGAMVGQALGRGDVGEARGVLRASVVTCTAIMGALALAIVLGAPAIVGIFDVDPTGELGALSVSWMELLGYGMPIVGVHIAIVGLMQGSGATRKSLTVNAVGTALQIPLSYLLGFPLGLGAWGIWVAFPLSFVVKAAMGAAFYWAGGWAKVGATV